MPMFILICQKQQHGTFYNHYYYHPHQIGIGLLTFILTEYNTSTKMVTCLPTSEFLKINVNKHYTGCVGILHCK